MRTLINVHGGSGVSWWFDEAPDVFIGKQLQNQVLHDIFIIKHILYSIGALKATENEQKIEFRTDVEVLPS
jgi:hypothetical protein